MNPITLSPGAFILLALACGCISALAAAAVMQRLAGIYVREAIYKAVDDANCILVRDISCELTLKSATGGFVAHSEIVTSGTKVSAQFVENWLESRGLVMSPKGQDFRVKTGSNKS